MSGPHRRVEVELSRETIRLARSVASYDRRDAVIGVRSLPENLDARCHWSEEGTGNVISFLRKGSVVVVPLIGILRSGSLLGRREIVFVPMT
jgi:hypothetical protein